ncbi:uncharacterized protein [Lepeophtheirus salmonis]|nr:shootin-1-like [Lepeophtheirus salmonis]
MVSFYPMKYGRASLAVMEGLEDIEEIDLYLEASTCVNCHQLSSMNMILEGKIHQLEKFSLNNEQRLKFMEENSIAWEKKALEYEVNLEILIKQRGSLQEEIQDLQKKNDKLLKEVEGLYTEIERKPEIPPPPPPPPPPPKFKLNFWKPSKKQRSKSLNRVEDLRIMERNPHAPMVLNSDILDAIKNRRYSLKHVDPIKEKEKQRLLRKESDQYYSEFDIAKIIERQIALAFSDESDEETEEWINKKINNDKGSFSSLDSNGSFRLQSKNTNKKCKSF